NFKEILSEVVGACLPPSAQTLLLPFYSGTNGLVKWPRSSHQKIGLPCGKKAVVAWQVTRQLQPLSMGLSKCTQGSFAKTFADAHRCGWGHFHQGGAIDGYGTDQKVW